MATDLMGLFNTSGYDPMKEQLKQQGLFQQQLAGATDPRSFIATVGSNMGGQLGGAAMRMFGDKTEEEKQQEAIKKALAETTGTDPVERLRSVAERLRSMGMEGAALKVDEQADAFEERSLKRSEREEKIKTKKDRPKIVADRIQVLMKNFNMTEAEAKTIADNDTSWNSYIKPPKDYAPSEYEKMLLAAGMTKGSPEFEKKMADYADAKLKAAAGDPVAIENAKLQAKLAEIELTKLKVDKEKEDATTRDYKNRLSFLTSTAQTKTMEKRIDDAKALANNWTTGYGAVAFDSLPATEARKLKNQINTIKANIGFDKLAQMRASSPTGGALGQVSERELYYLQSVLANLDTLTDAEDLKNNLDLVKKHYNNFLTMEKAGKIAAEEKWTATQSESFANAIDSGSSYEQALAVARGGKTPAEGAAPAGAGGTPKPTKRFNPATGKVEAI